MFFGTDFDRVTLFMVRLPALLISANWRRHTRPAPRLRSRGYERNRQIASASVYDDTQTPLVHASFILGHRILGWGVAHRPHHPEVPSVSGHPTPASEHHPKAPVIPEVEDEQESLSNSSKRFLYRHFLNVQGV